MFSIRLPSCCTTQAQIIDNEIAVDIEDKWCQNEPATSELLDEVSTVDVLNSARSATDSCSNNAEDYIFDAVGSIGSEAHLRFPSQEGTPQNLETQKTASFLMSPSGVQTPGAPDVDTLTEEPLVAPVLYTPSFNDDHKFTFPHTVHGVAAETEHLFIFVNPTSGGNLAQAYLDEFPENQNSQVSLGQRKIQIKVFNLRDGDTGKKPGVLQLRQISSLQDTVIRVMVAGGDGTVAWLISELHRSGVDMRNVAIGHIPFGTGNDFARVTGWGPGIQKHPIGLGRANLLHDLAQWLAASIEDFDVWQVTLLSEEEFLFVKDGRKCFLDQHKLQHGIERLEDGTWLMQKPMINYFSFGTNERIGLGFDKKRTRSRLGNLAVYLYEGVKKLAFRRAPMVSDVVAELVVTWDTASSQTETCPISFDTQAQNMCRLKKGSASLVFLNIPSFGGGANPWSWSNDVGALGVPQTDKDLLQHRQAMGDQKLEVMTYSHAFKASADIMKAKAMLPVNGNGSRLAASNGPFTVQFKSPHDETETSNDKVYFQVDGEFFVGVSPQHASVELWMTIKVLKKAALPAHRK